MFKSLLLDGLPSATDCTQKSNSSLIFTQREENQNLTEIILYPASIHVSAMKLHQVTSIRNHL